MLEIIDSGRDYYYVGYARSTECMDGLWISSIFVFLKIAILIFDNNLHTAIWKLCSICVKSKPVILLCSTIFINTVSRFTVLTNVLSAYSPTISDVTKLLLTLFSDPSKSTWIPLWTKSPTSVFHNFCHWWKQPANIYMKHLSSMKSSSQPGKILGSWSYKSRKLLYWTMLELCNLYGWKYRIRQ